MDAEKKRMKAEKAILKILDSFSTHPRISIACSVLSVLVYYGIGEKDRDSFLQNLVGILKRSFDVMDRELGREE